MRSNIVFYVMIIAALAQAGCAPQPKLNYEMNALIDGVPPSSPVETKAEVCYDGSRGYALRFAARAEVKVDMGTEAVRQKISLRLNIEIDDISKITVGEQVEVGNDNNIHGSAVIVFFPPAIDLLEPPMMGTGTMTITALSENGMSGSASLRFTDPEDIHQAVDDSRLEVAFNDLAIVNGCDTPNAAGIQFVLDDTYRVGERVQVKIQNNGQLSYFYTRLFAACELSYFEASGRNFLIPPGTHCDLREYIEIKPGETATLFEWDLSECIEDLFGCVKSQPLPPGTYTIRGAFYSFPDAESTAIAEATIEVIEE